MSILLNVVLKHRNFLIFMGNSCATVEAGCFPVVEKQVLTAFTNIASDARAVGRSLSFHTVKGSISLPTDGWELNKPVKDYNKYEAARPSHPINYVTKST